MERNTTQDVPPLVSRKHCHRKHHTSISPMRVSTFRCPCVPVHLSARPCPCWPALGASVPVPVRAWDTLVCLASSVFVRGIPLFCPAHPLPVRPYPCPSVVIRAILPVHTDTCGRGIPVSRASQIASQCSAPRAVPPNTSCRDV